MHWIGKTIIISGMVLVAISLYGKSDTKTVQIDHHVFIVPKEYLIQGSIPWLPASQHDGLMFYLNPKAPLQDRNSVLIQSSTVKCPHSELRKLTPQPSACNLVLRDVINQREEIEKIYPYNDSTQWLYRVKGGKNQGFVVAHCSPMGDGDGLCYSLSKYGDFIYSVGLKDSEMEMFPDIQKKVFELISSWEKK